MNCRRTTTAVQSIFRLTIGLVAIAMPLALTTWVCADEATRSEAIGEAAIDNALIAPVAQPAPPEPQPDPSQGDFPNSFVPRTRHDPNVLSTEPIAGESTDAKQPQMPQMKAWQRKQQEQQEKMNPERAMLEQQIQMLHMQLAQLASRQQQAKANLQPDDAQFIAVKLQHVHAHLIAVTLQKILGDTGPRIAFDTRVNMLLVRGNEKQISDVVQLVKTLDQPSEASAKDPGADAQTLQLRIVWLVDGVDGKEPAHGIDVGSQQSDGFVSPQVVDALLLLGFDTPKVVCQQVTTLTLGTGGQFKFAVPVLVNEHPWQLGGSGMVMSAGNDRFSLQFELEVEQQNNPLKGRLGGSIYSPLGHYTVMGTTTFVETSTGVPEDGKEGATLPQQRQHLSAFVVYLDHAPEFPADKSEKAKAKAAATPGEEDPFGK